MFQHSFYTKDRQIDEIDSWSSSFDLTCLMMIGIDDGDDADDCGIVDADDDDDDANSNSNFNNNSVVLVSLLVLKTSELNHCISSTCYSQPFW
uniref:Uncharacterized protein n=1 Tax=Setaria digitata TaxID=48799 RepID=A0A915PY90_9BILA